MTPYEEISTPAEMSAVVRRPLAKTARRSHAAAQPSHDRAAAIPFDDFDTNAVGTLDVLAGGERLVGRLERRRPPDWHCRPGRGHELRDARCRISCAHPRAQAGHVGERRRAERRKVCLS